MLTEDQLKDIEKAAKLATPGPWRHGLSDEEPSGWEWLAIWSDSQNGRYWVADMVLTNKLVARRDAAFVAGSRDWVPQLLETVRELQAAIRRPGQARNL